MNTIKSTIHTEAIFSDDEQHRYLLKKIWDEKKPLLYSDNDVSTFRWRIITRSYHCSILNQLANSEQYGAVYLVNLFSNIKTPENLKHIKEPYDKHTDIH